MENKAKIITVAGKGGVGKTSICACIVRLLTEKYPDKKILAIDADPAVGLSVALGVDVKLTLRPESSGCYCKVNSYLKEVIGILASSFDYVVIDGEAGIEQIQRRVMEKVTHLLLITDQSKKGGQVISTIKSVADELIDYQRVGAIINRVTNPELVPLMQVPGVEILTAIPADATFAANDIRGKSVMDLPADSVMLQGVQEALLKIEIL